MMDCRLRGPNHQHPAAGPLRARGAREGEEVPWLLQDCSPLRLGAQPNLQQIRLQAGRGLYLSYFRLYLRIPTQFGYITSPSGSYDYLNLIYRIIYTGILINKIVVNFH